MTDFSQNIFITHWNKVVKSLSQEEGLKDLPRLFSSGACCGFSFLLAEYIRSENEDQFYEIYNYICATEPKEIAKFIMDCNKPRKNPETNNEEVEKKIKFANKIFDFIYKVSILDKQQTNGTICLDNETDNDKWIRETVSAPNHLRIGNKLTVADVDNKIGVINKNFKPKITGAIEKLSHNESLEIGIFDQISVGHSILVYRTNTGYNIFDSSIGRKIPINTMSEAVDQVMYSTNYFITGRARKYTLFDKLWSNSKLFKAFAIICFPITIPWLIGDFLLAKPLTDAELKKSPLHTTVCLTWGKISAVPDKLPPGVIEIATLNAVRNSYLLDKTIEEPQEKKAASLQVYHTMSGENNDQQRYRIAATYVAKNPSTLFAKALIQHVPELQNNPVTKQNLAP